MTEPNKETVRPGLSPGPEQAGPAPVDAKHDTVRIVLPRRNPVTPIRHPPPKITPVPASDASAETSAVLPRRPATITPSTSLVLQPLPKPPGIEKENGPVPPAPVESPKVNRGPVQETARISLLPRPAPAAPLIITSKPLSQLDVITRPLCWALLGISAVIFLIQIWNYVVS
jgi:hypothetical protein